MMDGDWLSYPAQRSYPPPQQHQPAKQSWKTVTLAESLKTVTLPESLKTVTLPESLKTLTFPPPHPATSAVLGISIWVSQTSSNSPTAL